MRAWWEGLAVRDRRMVTLGAWLAGLLLLYGALWAPLVDARDAWRVRAIAADAALQQMHQHAARLAGQPRRTATVSDGRSLLARVDGGAREAGLGGVLLRVEPVAAGRVRVLFQAAPFDRLVDWLQPLAEQGVQVEELSVQRSPGVGLVDVRLTLAQPGSL